jgi:hypothetical protein
MGSSAVIHEPSFIKIASGIQKLIGGTHTHRQQRDLISLLYFFKWFKKRVWELRLYLYTAVALASA